METDHLCRVSNYEEIQAKLFLVSPYVIELSVQVTACNLQISSSVFNTWWQKFIVKHKKTNLHSFNPKGLCH